MKLFDHIKQKGAVVERIDGIFPIFLVENIMNEFIVSSYVIQHGWGNGYVGLPPWHPYYKMDYDNIPVSCHGGLTYAGLDDDEKLWVIGFDTAHSGDDKYKWPKQMVLSECQHIVYQCMEVKEAQRIIKLHKLKNL